MPRELKNKIYQSFTHLAFLSCKLVLIFLCGVLVWQGAKSLSLEFLLMPARNFGASGGILYQILGSFLLVSVAAMLVVPFAVGTALFRSEYLKSSVLKNLLDLSLLSLNSIPSISYGLFGLIFFVNFLGTGISWFVGSIILAIMMLPTISLSTFQAINSIPVEYRENGHALGLNQWQIIRSILLPQSFHGVVTGLLIGLARAIGETAPIMFIATAFSGTTIPSSPFEPVSSLPTHILALAQQATNPDALRNAWGASLTLILIVAIFSSLAFYTRNKLQTLSKR